MTQTITLPRAVIEQALEALEQHGSAYLGHHGKYWNAIAALKQALEQAQQEPAQPAQRQLDTAIRQWEQWKQYALDLQSRLVKYEGGSPMVLNSAPVHQEGV